MNFGSVWMVRWPLLIAASLSLAVVNSGCGEQSAGSADMGDQSDAVDDSADSDATDDSVSDSTPPDSTDSTPPDSSDGQDDGTDDSNSDPTPGDDSGDTDSGDNQDGEDSASSDSTPSNGSFSRETLDDTVVGPAFVSVGDINGDSKPDLVLSSFGGMGLSVPNGTVNIYYQGADRTTWTKEPLIEESDSVPFPNMTTLVDRDYDGDMDIVTPVGFLVCKVIPLGGPCGGIFWWEQTSDGWVKHEVLENSQDLFYHHAEVIDFDGDGILDIVTTGESRTTSFFGGDPEDEAVAQWFRGMASGDRFESEPRIIGEGMGSAPTVVDLDGDGDLDIASAEFFIENASFAWYERIEDPSDANPAGRFVRHIIDNEVGPSIMLQLIPDLFGDGELVAVGSNHTNTAKSDPDPWESAIYAYSIPADPTQSWPRRKLSEGIVSVASSMFAAQAAPGLFGYGDIDHDGDIDLLVSGDGDPAVYWLEQLGSDGFATHVLNESLPQAGGTQVVDLDGDGLNELIVTGYEDNVMYMYQFNRE